MGAVCAPACCYGSTETEDSEVDVGWGDGVEARVCGVLDAIVSQRQFGHDSIIVPRAQVQWAFITTEGNSVFNAAGNILSQNKNLP